MSKEIKTVQDLTPDQENPNKGTARGRYLIERSLEENGAGRSIVVDRDGKVIAGNKTLEAWVEMGGEVEVIRTDGKKLVVVQRDDLDLDDPNGAARRLSYFDNRVQEANLDWDAGVLLNHAQGGLDLDSMWSSRELERLIGQAVDLTLAWEETPQPSRDTSVSGDTGNAAQDTPKDDPGVAVASSDDAGSSVRTDNSQPERRVSHVVMVQLFFNTDNHPVFVEQAKTLMEAYEIDNLTDLVRKVVEDAYDSLD